MKLFTFKTLLMCLMIAATLAVGCSKEEPKAPQEPETPVNPEDGEENEEPKPLVEGSFELTIDEVLEDSITITITPSEEVDYYYACLASDTEKYLGGEDDAIVSDQLAGPNAEMMIFRGPQTLQFQGLIAHSHYRLLYFQYDTETKNIFGKLYRSERITTPNGT